MVEKHRGLSVETRHDWLDAMIDRVARCLPAGYLNWHCANRWRCRILWWGIMPFTFALGGGALWWAVSGDEPASMHLWVYLWRGAFR